MYHFRNILGTRIETNATPVDHQEALYAAFVLSARVDMAVYVCKDSDSNGNPGYVEIASVKCLS